ATGAAVLFGEDLVPDPPHEPEFAVLNGLFRLVSNLSEDGPLLLSIDDIQWADAPTVTALEFLSRRIDSLPVAVLATERPAATEPSDSLDAIRADGGTIWIDLQPLARESADRMVTEATGTAPDQA